MENTANRPPMMSTARCSSLRARRWKRRGALWTLTVSLLGAAWACVQEAALEPFPEPGDNASNNTPNNTPADAGSDVGDAPEDVLEDSGGGDVADMGEVDAGSDAGDAEAPPFDWSEGLEVPIEVVDGLALVDTRVDDGGPYPFVFDTLSQTIFVDVDIVGDDLFHQATVQIGPEDLGELVVKGRLMAPDEVNMGVDIGGLIGQRYFDQRFTLVDYQGSRAILLGRTPPAEAGPPPGLEGQPRHEFVYELPNLFSVVKPEIGAAGEVALLGDTSSRISFVAQRVFDAIDDGSLPQVGGYRFTSNFGEDAAFLTRLPVVRFGDLEARDLVVAIIPDDNHLTAVLEPNGVSVEGFLGATFWNRFALGIDGFRIPNEGNSEGGSKLMIVWGDGAPTAQELAAWTRVGVELTLREGEVTVEMVFEGSSAENEGLAVGTVIEAIDGDLTLEMSLEEARARLRGEAGQERVLRVRAPEDEAAREVTVLVEEIL